MDKKVFVKFKEDAVSLAILFALPVLYLKGALFFTDNVLGSPLTDIRGEVYAKLFGYRELLSSSIPLWNPYNFGGMPFTAAPGTAFFYPFNLICAFLPIHYAVNWDIALHLFFSEMFTYYLLRNYGVNRFGSMIAGIVYAFSAPQIMHIYAGHLIAMTSMPWMPLMFLSVDKFVRNYDMKYGILLSVAISLQLLAGYPQYLFYSLIAISLYSLLMLINLYLNGRGWAEIGKRSLFFAVFLLFGLVISAVQILPTMEIMKYSTRQNLTYEWVSVFSFPPENLITLLIPDFFGDMLNTAYWGKNYLWEMTSYVGIFPLLLAFVALFYARRRVVWFFAGLTILSIILSMGKYTPLLKFLYHYVPGFNLFRGNSKFIFLTALSLSVLSGFGIDLLIRRIAGPKKWFGWVSIGVCIFPATALFIMYDGMDEAWFREAITRVIFSGDLYVNGESFMRPGFVAAVCASFRRGILWAIGLLILGTAILLLYHYGKIKGKIGMSAIFAIIIFDLFTFGMRYMLTFDVRDTFPDIEIIDFLKQDKEPFRIAAPQFDPNIGTFSGIETLNGYGNMMIKRYSEFINFTRGIPPDSSSLWVNINSINKLTDLLNVKYLVLQSNQTLNDPAFMPVFDNNRYRIYQDVNALPRAFVVHGVKVIEGRDNIFRELVSPEFAPLSYAIIEERGFTPLNKMDHPGPLPKFVEHSNNKVIVEANLTEPGLLVLGDIYYPGWKAFVDGKESKIFPANYVMRSVALPKGRHIVEFRYDPLSFKIGAVITLLSLVLVTGFFVWDLRKKRRSIIR